MQIETGFYAVENASVEPKRMHWRENKTSIKVAYNI